MWEREYRISWNGCTGTYLKIRLKEGHLLEGVRLSKRDLST